MRRTVPFPLWVFFGAAGLGLASFGFLHFLDGSFHTILGHETWFGVSGGVLILLWCFTRPANPPIAPTHSDGPLNAKATQRKAEGPPPDDPAVVARRRERARSQSQQVRRGPRWIRSPLFKRYDPRLPRDD